MRGEDDEDAVELAVELDRLLARRDAETGALATETLEFVGAVSPEFLFGRAKETAPVNESIAAPGSFYACQGAIAMTMECVGAVYRASAEAMRRRRRERESSGGACSTSETSFDATKTTLCVNGDHGTAWNERKRNLMEVFNSDAVSERDRRMAVMDELAFARVVQSRWPKAPSAWAHRRWVLNQYESRKGERNAKDTKEAFENELAACDAAILKKRMNYVAWSHRAWALTLLDEDDFATLDDELRASGARIKRNVSDYCELHYRTRLMARFAARAKSAEYITAIKSDVAFVRELIETHPGRESLWSYLRFLYVQLIAQNTESENTLDDEALRFVDKVSGKDGAATLDPSWAENSMATQRRLGGAFLSWVRIVLARRQGDSCSPSFVRLTDGFTIDKW